VPHFLLFFSSQEDTIQEREYTVLLSEATKLFVGQVPSVCTEEMLRPVFMPYGTILEISIMRDKYHKSKGCAWVSYSTKSQAESAIDNLHDKHCIPPQTNPLQVRLAESPPTLRGGGARSSYKPGIKPGYSSPPASRNPLCFSRRVPSSGAPRRSQEGGPLPDLREGSASVGHGNSIRMDRVISLSLALVHSSSREVRPPRSAECREGTCSKGDENYSWGRYQNRYRRGSLGS